ncbi:MAG TPA: aldolase/citrate lyase family protein [Burkholderiales bacterium]|jgi:2-keto-3-deoxy-L-rhamnonate aldolase RhmA|nr:aldolase/citrate lyase family protein [Burkholderiales bacterium]
MTVVPNHAKRQLLDGKLAIGLGVRQARTVDIAQIAKTSGFDWLFIDCEHGSMSLDMASQIACAALGVGVTPVVRVPGHEHHHATRALDNGAQGIVVPHVDTAEHAGRIADYCRFPPLGHRSMGSGLPQIGFAQAPIEETARIVNEETLVVVMLESAQAVDSCEAIAAVPGVDVLLIGTNDLCLELGVPGKFDDARVAEAYARVIAACRKHGKSPGMGGVGAPALLERYIGMGMRFVLAGSDLALLMQAAGARAALVRSFLKLERQPR